MADLVINQELSPFLAIDLRIIVKRLNICTSVVSSAKITFFLIIITTMTTDLRHGSPLFAKMKKMWLKILFSEHLSLPLHTLWSDSSMDRTSLS